MSFRARILTKSTYLHVAMISLLIHPHTPAAKALIRCHVQLFSAIPGIFTLSGPEQCWKGPFQ